MKTLLIAVGLCLLTSNAFARWSVVTYYPAVQQYQESPLRNNLTEPACHQLEWTLNTHHANNMAQFRCVHLEN
jgi:hypothetical protein